MLYTEDHEEAWMEPSSHSALQLGALYLRPCTGGTRETISGSARDNTTLDSLSMAGSSVTPAPGG